MEKFQIVFDRGSPFSYYSLVYKWYPAAYGKGPLFCKAFSIWTYIIMFPLLIILSYLERPEKDRKQVADTDKS